MRFSYQFFITSDNVCLLVVISEVIFYKIGSTVRIIKHYTKLCSPFFVYILLFLYEFIGIIIKSVMLSDSACYLLPFSFITIWACSIVGNSNPFSWITSIMRATFRRSDSFLPRRYTSIIYIMYLYMVMMIGIKLLE